MLSVIGLRRLLGGHRHHTGQRHVQANGLPAVGTARRRHVGARNVVVAAPLAEIDDIELLAVRASDLVTARIRGLADLGHDNPHYDLDDVMCSDEMVIAIFSEIVKQIEY